MTEQEALPPLWGRIEVGIGTVRKGKLYYPSPLLGEGVRSTDEGEYCTIPHQEFQIFAMLI